MPSIAEQLRSAFEKLENGRSPSAAEVRVLRALRETSSDRKLAPTACSIALALAATIVLPVVGVLATLSLPEARPGHGVTLSLAIRSTDSVRSVARWTPGETFVIEARLSEDRFLHVLHLDANGELEFLFPLYDPASRSWDYLGYPDNHVPGGTPLPLPAASFPMHLAIDTARRGEEFFIGFATEERIDEGALLEVRRRVRAVTSAGWAGGAALEVLAEKVERLISREFAVVLARHRYRIEPAAAVR